MPFCVSGVQITCFFMILGSLISCADWSTENDRVVARVGDVYLYSSDFEEELGDFIDETDSILKTRNYIDSNAVEISLPNQYRCLYESTTAFFDNFKRIGHLLI